jgi:Flp pilus assembly protein TadD
MKNRALSAAVAVSLAAFLALPTYARADSRTAALVKKVKPAVVQVITYDASGKASKLGTGFFVNAAGDVITCRHVMEGATGANVRTSGGVDYPVTGIVAEDVDGDMVKLAITGSYSSLPFLPLAPDSPSQGDPILVVGNPEGLGWTVSDGIVSAVRPIPGFGALVQITAPISQGSSGSPVINAKGQVVGVVDFYWATGQNLNFAMPVSRIASLKGKTALSLRNWTSGGPAEPPGAAQDEVKQGLNDMSAGDCDAALDHFLNALKDNPNDALAWALGGYCWAQVGNWEMAAQCFERVVKLVPEWAEAHYDLGLAYGNLGRYDDEVREENEAIRIKPDYAEAHCNLGVAYGGLGRYEDAVRECKEAIRLKPDFALAHFSLGLAYVFLGDRGAALDEYNILKKLDTVFADGLHNLIYP